MTTATRQRAALLAWLLAAGLARAEPSSPDGDPGETEKAREARTAFDHGRALLDEGRPEEACAAFAESHRMVPTVATLLNLGVCHRRSGRFATAYGFFQKAEAAAALNGDGERVATAERDGAEARALAGTLTFRSAGPVSDDVEVWLDGSLVPRSSWPTRTPLDAGEHGVEVRLRGRIIQVVHISVVDGVPATVDLTPPPAPSGALPKRTVPALSRVPAPAPSRPVPIGSYIAAGVGFASLGVGLAFGLAAWGKYTAAETECPTHRCASTHARDLYDSAQGNATVANVAAGIGAASLVTGFVIYFAHGRDTERRPDMAIVTTSMSGGAGASLRGDF